MAVYSSLRDRAVLISGGGGGIGASMVAAFACQGANVAFLEIDGSAAKRTAEEVYQRSGKQPVYRQCDIRDTAASSQAVADLAHETGPFRALINNAGNDEAHAFADVTPAYWDDRIAVNLKHQYFLAQAVAPSMAAAGGGAIVNFGSICWIIGAPNVPVYSTAKAAVEGLTKALARELGPQKIRVNSIAPGWVMTERQLAKGALAPEKFDFYLDRQCLKEHINPSDVAEMALWLAADESRLCTSHTFYVDAGVS